MYDCRNWETEHYNSVLEITVSFLGIHKWKPEIYIGFSPALHLQCVYMAGLREKDLDSTQKQLLIYLSRCIPYTSHIRTVIGTVIRKCLSPKNLFYYLAKCLTKNFIFGGLNNFVSRQIK